MSGFDPDLMILSGLNIVCPLCSMYTLSSSFSDTVPPPKKKSPGRWIDCTKLPLGVNVDDVNGDVDS